MPKQSPTLQLLCGKNASGKSTLAAQLSRASHTVLIAEDDWLAALYPGEMSSIADYVRNAARLQNAMGPHVASLLRAGTSVVLDFHANTLARRQWMRGLLNASKVAHTLHYLQVADALCIARLHVRNASDAHAFAATEEQFLAISKYFVAPTAEEGFHVVVHSPSGNGA